MLMATLGMTSSSTTTTTTTATPATAALSDHTITGLEYTDGGKPVIWNPGTASFTLHGTGTAYGTYSTGLALDETTTTSYTGEWLTGGDPAELEVMATITSGTISSGVTGSWMTMGSTITWSKSYGSSGSSTAILAIQIRRISDATVVASSSITLTVSRT